MQGSDAIQLTPVELGLSDCGEHQFGIPELRWPASLGHTDTPRRMLKISSSKTAGGARTGGVPSGAHGATNKEHHVCARRRVSEAAGSPLRILGS